MALLLVAIGITAVIDTPDMTELRTWVDGAGVWAPALFFGAYVVLALVPFPKAVLTAVGGAVFGLWAGAALAWGAALIGATLCFGLGRLLGRDAVDRLVRGRLARVDELLGTHGIAAVLVVRLVPLVPFMAINYASGLTGVRLRHYVVGSAIGMVPGTLAYAALGAYGDQPWDLVAAGAGLLVLVLVGSWWARRLDPGHPALSPGAERPGPPPGRGSRHRAGRPSRR